MDNDITFSTVKYNSALQKVGKTLEYYRTSDDNNLPVIRDIEVGLSNNTSYFLAIARLRDYIEILEHIIPFIKIGINLKKLHISICQYAYELCFVVSQTYDNKIIFKLPIDENCIIKFNIWLKINNYNIFDSNDNIEMLSFINLLYQYLSSI